MTSFNPSMLFVGMLAATSAACVPKQAKRPPQTPAELVSGYRKQALNAYERDELHATIVFGQRYLQQAPDDRQINAIVGYAACRTGDGWVANEALGKLYVTRARMLRALCRSHGTKLDKAWPHIFDGKKEPAAYASRAWAAYHGGHLHAALLWGERSLELTPGDQPLRAMVVASACMLGDITGARQLEAKLAASRRKDLETFCAGRGVALRSHKKKTHATAAGINAKQKPSSTKLREDVWIAYRRGDHRTTITLGSRYLQRHARDAQILSIVGVAACETKDATTAQRVMKALPSRRRGTFYSFCLKHKLSLHLPMERFDRKGARARTKRKPRPSLGRLSRRQKKKAEELRKGTWAAYRRGSDQATITLGEEYLQMFPGDKQVLSIVGASACKTGDTKAAQRVLSRLSPRRRAMLRNFCFRRGVVLK
ncbi:MAG: hypothetical protein JRH20_11550 [Deltaproteobacteria bacterium]|nr:hypothetical protein [Deltaproteobacteria bacterium]